MTKELGSRIGGRIREMREASGLTQARLAAAIGITTVSVSNIERGRALPGLVTLEAIATALGLSLRDLIPEATQPAINGGERKWLEGESARLALLEKSDRKIISTLIGLMLNARKH